LKKLDTTLAKDDKKVLEAEKYEKNNDWLMKMKFRYETKRQNTKTEFRSCNNILAIRKVANIAIPFSSFLPFLSRYPVNLI